jgi:hypothetical protein
MKWKTSDTLAYAILQSFDIGFVPWTGWSMRPADLLMVINDLVSNDRKRIVEFGSGPSSLLLACAARETGGQVWSVEHHPPTAQRIAKRAWELDLPLIMVQSPLVEAPDLEGSFWYDTRVLDQFLQLGPKAIDLVLVDGPPGNLCPEGMARLPALDYLQDTLTDDASLYLDDTDRLIESEIFSLWHKRLPDHTRVESDNMRGLIPKGSFDPRFSL